MAIRDRLARLEAARQAKVGHDDRIDRPVYPIDGQSEAEAHRLSDYAAWPIERCLIISEDVHKSLFLKVDGDLVLYEKELTDLRRAQTVRRLKLGEIIAR